MRRPRPDVLRGPLLVIILAFVVNAGAARPARADGNLLAGKQPSSSGGVANVGVLTDGVAAFEGSEWNTTVAAPFASNRSFVEFDLGASVPIAAAYLQGDNNDEYVLAVSEDHETFVPLWTAEPRPEPGLRERWSDALAGHGRWVRLTVRGGDMAYSVSELQLFSERPPAMPPPLRRLTGESQSGRVRSCLLYLVTGFLVLLVATDARSRGWRLLLPALAPLVALGLVVGAIQSAWPLENREVAFVRACAAAIALGAAFRIVAFGRRWPAHRGALTASLAAAAVMAFAAFYNLGHPQFWNHARGEPEFVHTNDLRVYQPFAKYFKELQYDGVYMASVLAYAEDRRGGSLESMGGVELRGLNDHRVRRVRDVVDQIREVRARFSDERWQEFKQDMRFFQEVMGPEYISTLTDHGANATPVWVFFARMLLGHAPASERLLVAAGLVDGILLLLMAFALWRSFGAWTMLLALTVFGANDLYMFGTNWTGATLRHDWLALLGFGAAALKSRRWTAAGICLALSALIRFFPVVSLLGVALPALWWYGERWRHDRRPPGLRALMTENREATRVLLTAGATVVVMVLLTGALYSFGSWANWLQKVTLLNRDVGVNEISLRALIAGADSMSGATLQARILIFIGAETLAIACMALLARRRPLHQAMLIAMPLVLAISNPSNYYSHFIFLLALLADPTAAPQGEGELRLAAATPGPIPLRVPFQRVAGPLLALCVGGYWASMDPDLDRHFQDSTFLLFAALLWLYANLLRADPATRAFLSASEDAPGASAS